MCTSVLPTVRPIITSSPRSTASESLWPPLKQARPRRSPPGIRCRPRASRSTLPAASPYTVTWPTVHGLSYNLYWSTRPIYPDHTAADNVIRYAPGGQFVHTGVTTGLTYCYIVTAMNSAGESADSMQVCGTGAGGIRFLAVARDFLQGRGGSERRCVLRRITSLDVARIHMLLCHHWPMHTASDGF